MIRGECVDCGPIELANVVVHAWSDSFTCSWTCTACGLPGAKECSPRIAGLLRNVGCPLDRVTVYEERGSGPPIGWDDVLDMVVELRGNDWWSELIID